MFLDEMILTTYLLLTFMLCGMVVASKLLGKQNKKTPKTMVVEKKAETFDESEKETDKAVIAAVVAYLMTEKGLKFNIPFQKTEKLQSNIWSLAGRIELMGKQLKEEGKPW
ncbi:hypothetical protein DRO26_01700 [Candidatus Bathyarchaeota archaeon]|nr:MAG: hypothetical protein DRO26_01700 [Candidatus Bathyarchaeota archaeon]